jgi:undecaprenyl-diphosphatase
MLTLTQALVLGLLQGFTELFPISSLGHSVLVPAILHWNVDQSSDGFLAFVVATHGATALVLLCFFYREWLAIVKGVLRSLYLRRLEATDTSARLGWLVVVSTIPAGLLGVLFESSFQKLFSAPELIAGVLFGNGIILYAAEALRKDGPEEVVSNEKIAGLTWGEAVGIGIAQAFALVPGFSRTGLAMTGSLASGLSHENAARYAFLLAAPIIGAAALLKLPDLFLNGGAELPVALVGALAAALAAYLSVKYLTKYFETKTLKPFALYCIAAGLVALALLIR